MRKLRLREIKTTNSLKSGNFVQVSCSSLSTTLKKKSDYNNFVNLYFFGKKLIGDNSTMAAFSFLMLFSCYLFSICVFLDTVL